MKSNSVINMEDKAVRVQYDADLLISEGKSRYETKWKNKKTRWSMLLKRLSESFQTHETHAEYMKMSKDRQGQIKDIGGFVGGHLKDGRRKSGNVTACQILTLDADFAPPDLVGEIEDSFVLDCAMAVYSTHKHTPDKPRLRLIIPLDREVTPDEYEAISRKVAEKVGMDYFDDSTYQPTRLMYWPSHSADVDPYFWSKDAPILKADDVLAEYRDWTDTAEWPESSRMSGIRKKLADKQGDPTEKKGIVGIFCRAYTVVEAMDKFLPGVYAPTAKEDRYTYTAGSTAAGVVIYEGGKFMYSNHATDPLGGQLLNAFDLVRLYKFGDLDDGEENRPVNRRESWRRMSELMQDDPACQQTRDSEAAAEFGSESLQEEWQQKLIRNENLTLKPAMVNATLILENDPELEGIRLNWMTGRIESTGMPWEPDQTGWSDTHDACLLDWLARKYGVEFSAAKLRQAVIKVSYDRKYHPVKEYLDALPEWDGIERLDRLLIDYLGATDTLYTREATRKTLTAAVARIYEPGIKFDTMLVLVGPQGAGKSTFFERLVAGRREWFSDSLRMDMMNRIKDSGELVRGKWIIEIGEMTGMKKADIEAVKGFVSSTSDDFRAAYGHYPEDHLRQCIIVGSTNQEDGFLRDVTGNRRFWPVNIKKGKRVKARDLTPEIVAQVWAEAKIAYELGEELILSPEAEVMAADAQRDAMEQDDRQGLVERYLNRLLPDTWELMSRDERLLFLESDEEGTELRTTVSNIEIWVEALGRRDSAIEAKDSYAIAKIMAKIPGWQRTEKRIPVTSYGRQRIYERVVPDK